MADRPRPHVERFGVAGWLAVKRVRFSEARGVEWKIEAGDVIASRRCRVFGLERKNTKTGA